MSGTETSIRVLMGTLPTAAKTRLLRELTGEVTPAQTEANRIMRRAEVAQVLGRSLRAIDLLAAQGHLQKIVMPGRRRGGGFRAADVFALFNGGGKEA